VSIADELMSAPDRDSAYAVLEGILTPMLKTEGMVAVSKIVCDAIFGIIEERDEAWRNITYSEVTKERTECCQDAKEALTAYLEASKGVIDRTILIDTVRDSLYARFKNEAPPYGAPENETKH
jgi:hypothetical protein